MKTWDLFLPDVLPYVPGCPEPVAEGAVRRAAQEFFHATRLWKLWLPEIVTADGITEYGLFLEPKSDLVRLERATLDGREIAVRAQDELPPDWKTYPHTLCDGVHTDDRETVVLLPPKAAGQALLVEVSMAPSAAATGVEDRFFRYASQIATGAVAALKTQSGKSYSDPAAAGYWRDQFNGHMAVADIQRFRGFSSSRPRRRIQTF